MSRLKSSSSSVEIEMDSSDTASLIGPSSATSELEQYLLEQKRSQNNNVFGSYFSSVGTSLGKYIPKRAGGTGNIEDDIAVRFGNMFRSGTSSTNGNADSSGVSNGTSSSSCCTLVSIC